MAIASFTPGQRLLIQEKLYEISRKLSDSEWQIEDLGTGRYEIKTDDELLSLYAKNELRFHIESSRAKTWYDTNQVSGFDQIPSDLQEEAKIRLAYVRAIIKAGIKHLTEKNLAPVITHVHEKIKVPSTPPNWSTVYRWCKRYSDGGQDIRALVTRDCAKGNRTRRYEEHFLGLVRKAIATIYLTREQPTIQDTLSSARDLVKKENQLRPKNMCLPLPTYAVVKSEIYALPAFDRDVARLGRQAALVKYRTVTGENTANKPLERAEIDHTIIDIMVVDDETMLPLGRPTLTMCQDVMTRCGLGMYVGFEPPSFSAVAQCLKHSIMPNIDLQEKYPNIQNEWDCHGVMETLVVDNGLEFHSKNLEALCCSFGINIQYSPRKQPWFKPGIERLIGSINRGAAHGNPGTTFSNILEKDDYDAMKNATIRLSTLIEIIHIWIVDIHHQEIKKKTQQQPIKIWRDNISRISVLLPTNPQDLDCLTGAIKTRVLTHKGIEMNCLFYNSKQLETLRRFLGNEIKVTIRYNHADLEHIYVIHPKNNEAIRVPSLKPEYTKGLSLWQHKICRRFAKQHLNRIDIEAIAHAKAIIRELITRDFGLKKMALHDFVWVTQSNQLYFADERQAIIPTNTGYRIAMASG